MQHLIDIFVMATLLSFATKAASFVLPPPAISIHQPEARPSTMILMRSAEAVDAIRYRGDDNCDDEYDAIVIGSGIGGLTTASLLAQSKEKFKVLLLEQHTVAGGCCHTFQHKGYTFPTGIHYIGNMHEGDEMRKMLDALALPDDPVLWDQIDPITDTYDTVVLGDSNNLRRYRIVGGGLQAQAKELKKQFPPETHAAIDKYYTHIEKAAKASESATVLKCLPLPITKFLRVTGLHRLIARDFRKYASTTVAKMVESLKIDDEDLRAVLTYNWEDYGCEPSRAAFLHHALVLKHFSGSAFYPRGGPSNIAKKIIPSITNAGGNVLTGVPVKRIVLDKETGRAVGVEMMDGKVIRAKHAVISDAGLVNTVQHLLSSSSDKSMQETLSKKYFGATNEGDQQFNRLHEGSSALNLFVGLKGDHESDFNLPRGQLWTYPNSSVEQHLHELGSMSLEEATTKLQPKDIGLVFISSSSCKDSTWRDEHPGRTTLEIMANAPYKWFEEYAPDHHQQGGNEGASDPGGKPGSHGKEYKKMKEELSRLIWKRVVDVLSSSGATNLPLTLDQTDYHELGTPLTFAHFYWREKGGFYGLDHDINRYTSRNFFEVLRPEIKEIPGLYITGQDVSSCGFAGALIGGVFSAGKVLGANNPFSVFDDIKESRRLGLA